MYAKQSVFGYSYKKIYIFVVRFKLQTLPEARPKKFWFLDPF